MHGDGLADFAPAVDDLHEAGGDARVAARADERFTARRRVLRWLDDDAVAREQRGQDLPGRNRDREIPRRDHADDAEGLADDEGITLTFSRGANQQITTFILGAGRSTGITFTRK